MYFLFLFFSTLSPSLSSLSLSDFSLVVGGGMIGIWMCMWILVCIVLLLLFLKSFYFESLCVGLWELRENFGREMDDEYAKLIRRMNPPRYVAKFCYEINFLLGVWRRLVFMVMGFDWIFFFGKRVCDFFSLASSFSFLKIVVMAIGRIYFWVLHKLSFFFSFCVWIFVWFLRKQRKQKKIENWSLIYLNKTN